MVSRPEAGGRYHSPPWRKSVSEPDRLTEPRLRWGLGPHQAEREQLINHSAPLVLHAADALGPLERQDLISYGMFGLIDSITKFEPGSGDSFDAFARPRILEAILGELREIARSATSGSD